MPVPDRPGRPASRGFSAGRALGLAAAFLLPIAFAAVMVWRLKTERRPQDFEDTRRERRISALAVYAEREKLGSLVPPHDALLSIREPFVESAIARSLPFRQEFEEGRYVARLDSAAVRLEDGLAEVTLRGRGFLAGEEDSPIYVEITLRGLITVVEVDPDSGALTAGLTITSMGVHQAGPRELRRVVHPVARFFGRLRAEDWNRERRSVRLPIRLEREIVLPAIEGDVRVPESHVPVAVGVSAVTTLERRMALSLALAPDTAGGERPARPALSWNDTTRAAGGSPSRRRRDRARIEERVRTLMRRDPLWRGAVESDRDVTVIVPASVLRRLVARVSRRYLRGVGVDFRPAVTARLDQPVRAKLLGSRLGVGRIRGTVHISHLRGRLTVSGAPALALMPPRELEIRAPVAVLSGRGTVRMNMEWDPALLASLVCRGFRFDEMLDGEVVPLRHQVTTHVRFAVEASRIVGRPRVERDRVPISADLTDRSWSKVRTALVEQDRFLRCGIALNPDSAMARLRKLATEGFPVRLPARVFKPFHLPVALEDRYAAGDYRIEARAFDPAIDVEPAFLRFSFRARLRVVPPPDSARTARAEPQPPPRSPARSTSPAVPVTP